MDNRAAPAAVRAEKPAGYKDRLAGFNVPSFWLVLLVCIAAVILHALNIKSTWDPPGLFLVLNTATVVIPCMLIGFIATWSFLRSGHIPGSVDGDRHRCLWVGRSAEHLVAGMGNHKCFTDRFYPGLCFGRRALRNRVNPDVEKIRSNRQTLPTSGQRITGIYSSACPGYAGRCREYVGNAAAVFR